MSEILWNSRESDFYSCSGMFNSVIMPLRGGYSAILCMMKNCILSLSWTIALLLAVRFWKKGVLKNLDTKYSILYIEVIVGDLRDSFWWQNVEYIDVLLDFILELALLI